MSLSVGGFSRPQPQEAPRPQSQLGSGGPMQMGLPSSGTPRGASAPRASSPKALRAPQYTGQRGGSLQAPLSRNSLGGSFSSRGPPDKVGQADLPRSASPGNFHADLARQIAPHNSSHPSLQTLLGPHSSRSYSNHSSRLINGPNTSSGSDPDPDEAAETLAAFENRLHNASKAAMVQSALLAEQAWAKPKGDETAPGTVLWSRAGTTGSLKSGSSQSTKYADVDAVVEKMEERFKRLEHSFEAKLVQSASESMQACVTLCKGAESRLNEKIEHARNQIFKEIKYLLEPLLQHQETLLTERVAKISLDSQYACVSADVPPVDSCKGTVTSNAVEATFARQRTPPADSTNLKQAMDDLKTLERFVDEAKGQRASLLDGPALTPRASDALTPRASSQPATGELAAKSWNTEVKALRARMENVLTIAADRGEKPSLGFPDPGSMKMTTVHEGTTKTPSPEDDLTEGAFNCEGFPDPGSMKMTTVYEGKTRTPSPEDDLINCHFV